MGLLSWILILFCQFGQKKNSGKNVSFPYTIWQHYFLHRLKLSQKTNKPMTP
jgi:hypothetical protein